MLTRMRTRAADEGGFTLIELLVVILIIGILAAIAIPAFLSQTNKSYDSSAKTLAQTAQTAAETLATETGGSYATLSITKLHEIEPTIPTSEETTSGPALVGAKTKETNSGKGYEVTVKAQTTGDEFTISRDTEGVISRTCKIPTGGAGTNGCKVASGSTSGSW